MTLPEGVEKSTVRKPNGKVFTYYYWNPGRGTDREGERIKLPNADTQPVTFWAEVERRQTSEPTTFPPGSIGDLISRYRSSDEFNRLSEGTQSNYEVTIRRFEAHDTWGMVSVRDLTPLAAQTARDVIKETPVMANQMLSVGRTIWDWAIPLGLAAVNPFDKVKDFDIPDRGHVSWPSWVVDDIRLHAWPDLVRMERLGIMTCQRGSDLIRMSPEHRERNGLWCRPKKTRKRRRAFHIPLAAADALELDRWAETPVTFTNSRCDPDDADHPTILGLRGTGILARAEQRYEVDQLANDIGMARQNVEHYMRFRDEMKVGADGQKRLRLVKGKD